MSDSIHEILFEDFGMDTDTALPYMGMGSSRYNLNVLKGEDGTSGFVTNLKGNRVVQYTPPDNHPWKNCNVYFTLSSCYDPLTRNVYYWIFSQPVDVTGSDDYEYDNRLLRFNEDTEIIDTIFCDDKNYFGLDPAKPFKDSFVLGDWLYFNPRESEPKMIHITMAYNYTNYMAYDPTLTYSYGDRRTYFGGLFLALVAVAVGETPSSAPLKWERIDDCYQDDTDLNFDSEFRYAFNVKKAIPVHRPQCIYGTDADKHSNNVRASLFRFAYRFRYFDDTKSKFSAYSDVTLPQYDELWSGEVLDEIDSYNYIGVSIRLHSAALVKEIEIAFLESGKINWKRAKIINRREQELLDDTTYVYKFYNDDPWSQILELNLFETEDAVPRYANCQELINKNILTYGGSIEGFDNIDKNEIDVSLTPEQEEITTGISGLDFLFYEGTVSWINTSVRRDWWEGHYSLVSLFALPLATGDYIEVTIEGIGYQYRVLLADTLNINTLTTSLLAFLTTSFPLISFTDYGSNIINIIGTHHEILNIRIQVLRFGGATGTLVKARGFKTGAWHPFCIFYYDGAMRRSDAQTSKENVDAVGYQIDGTSVYIPLLGELSPTPISLAYRWIVNWEISHLPPTWAKYWKWGYSGNSLCSTFVQYVVERIEDDTPYTRLNITPLQTLKEDTAGNEFPNSIIDPWAYVEGDRIRVITEQQTVGNIGDPLDGVYDYTIVKLEVDDTTTPPTHWVYVQDFDYAGIGAGEGSLIEIYRPKKEAQSQYFYEFGEIMPIIEDSGGNLVHGVNSVSGVRSQDYSLALSAQGVFNAGDVYHIQRTPSKAIDGTESYFHESLWYSDFYSSDDYDKGKPGEELYFGERFLNIIRFSDPYLQKTRLNGLSTFDGNDFAEVNDVYGDILRIIEIGDTLKVYQRKKPSSILIGRTEYTDSSGEPNVVATSNRVLGSIRYSSTNYGTEFPESISRNNRFVYGFDVYNGVMWRDSPNGIFPISGRFESAQGAGSYRMETWFKDKAKALLVSGIEHCNVLTVWDENHKNLYVIFKDAVEEANDVAIMFHEPSNRWICFTDMGYTPAEGWDQILELSYETLWGFEGGIGYEFDEDTRFAFFNIGAKASGNPSDPGSGTTPNIRAFPTVVKLEIVPYAPTVSTEETATPAVVNLEFVPYAPLVKVYSIAIDVDTFTWAYDETGVAYLQNATFTLGTDSIVTITAIPTWLTVRNNLGQVLTAGDTLSNGAVIDLFPTAANYRDRLDSVSLIDNGGNTATITVTQTQSVNTPTVTFVVRDGTFTLSNGAAEFTYEPDPLVTATFSVSFDHDLASEEWKFFLVTDGLGNVLYVGYEYGSGILLSPGVSATKTVTLLRNLVAGDDIFVQIGTL
jgi:hypothetical protein